MTEMVMPAVILCVIACCDGAFAGFRAGAGRHGLVRHNRIDRRDAAIGLTIFAIVLIPLTVIVGVAVDDLRPWTDASWRMIMIVGPYAIIALIGLCCYLTLPWRLSYLASAVILGPFTLARPLIAIAGGLFAALPSGSAAIWLGSIWACGGALLLDPVSSWIIRRRTPLVVG